MSTYKPTTKDKVLPKSYGKFQFSEAIAELDSRKSLSKTDKQLRKRLLELQAEKGGAEMLVEKRDGKTYWGWRDSSDGEGRKGGVDETQKSKIGVGGKGFAGLSGKHYDEAYDYLVRRGYVDLDEVNGGVTPVEEFTKAEETKSEVTATPGDTTEDTTVIDDQRAEYLRTASMTPAEIEKEKADKAAAELKAKQEKQKIEEEKAKADKLVKDKTAEAREHALKVAEQDKLDDEVDAWEKKGFQIDKEIEEAKQEVARTTPDFIGEVKARFKDWASAGRYKLDPRYEGPNNIPNTALNGLSLATTPGMVGAAGAIMGATYGAVGDNDNATQKLKLLKRKKLLHENNAIGRRVLDDSNMNAAINAMDTKTPSASELIEEGIADASSTLDNMDKDATALARQKILDESKQKIHVADSTNLANIKYPVNTDSLDITSNTNADIQGAMDIMNQNQATADSLLLAKKKAEEDLTNPYKGKLDMGYWNGMHVRKHSFGGIIAGLGKGLLADGGKEVFAGAGKKLLAKTPDMLEGFAASGVDALVDKAAGSPEGTQSQLATPQEAQPQQIEGEIVLNGITYAPVQTGDAGGKLINKVPKAQFGATVPYKSTMNYPGFTPKTIPTWGHSNSGVDTRFNFLKSKEEIDAAPMLFRKPTTPVEPLKAQSTQELLANGKFKGDALNEVPVGGANNSVGNMNVPSFKDISLKPLINYWTSKPQTVEYPEVPLKTFNPAPVHESRGLSNKEIEDATREFNLGAGRRVQSSDANVNAASAFSKDFAAAKMASTLSAQDLQTRLTTRDKQHQEENNNYLNAQQVNDANNDIRYKNGVTKAKAELDSKLANQKRNSTFIRESFNSVVGSQENQFEFDKYHLSTNQSKAMAELKLKKAQAEKDGDYKTALALNGELENLQKTHATEYENLYNKHSNVGSIGSLISNFKRHASGGKIESARIAAQSRITNANTKAQVEIEKARLVAANIEKKNALEYEKMVRKSNQDWYKALMELVK